MAEANSKEGNVRMNFVFTPKDRENLKTITEFLEKKFGLSEDVSKTAAVRMSLTHMAEKIRKGEVQ
jgi:hypothetical protein